MCTNFIKIENLKGKIIGVIAIEKGSQEEYEIVSMFLEQKKRFKKATESEYHSFDADVIRKKGKATFCHLLPEE